MKKKERCYIIVDNKNMLYGAFPHTEEGEKNAKKSRNRERHTTARASLALATLALARASRKIQVCKMTKIAKNTGVQRLKLLKYS